MKDFVKYGIFVITMCCFLVTSCEKEDPGLEKKTSDTVVPPEIHLNKSEIELFLDDTLRLSYQLEPDTIIVNDLLWSSSNDTFATVTQDGLVHAKKIGGAGIKLSSDSLGIYAMAFLRILPIPLTGIKINNIDSILMVVLNQPAQIPLAFIPDNATFKDVIWETPAESAVIDSLGYLSVKKMGLTWVSVLGGGQHEFYDVVYILPIKENQLIAADYSTYFTHEGKYKIDLAFGSPSLNLQLERVEVHLTDGFTFNSKEIIENISLNVQVEQNRAKKFFLIEIDETTANEMSFGSMVKLFITSDNGDYVVSVNGNNEVRFD